MLLRAILLGTCVQQPQRVGDREPHFAGAKHSPPKHQESCCAGFHKSIEHLKVHRLIVSAALISKGGNREIESAELRQKPSAQDGRGDVHWPACAADSVDYDWQHGDRAVPHPSGVSQPDLLDCLSYRTQGQQGGTSPQHVAWPLVRNGYCCHRGHLHFLLDAVDAGMAGLR
ncbi:MAG: hypothetical protein RL441_892 [Actinomycetota bacterium]